MKSFKIICSDLAQKRAFEKLVKPIHANEGAYSKNPHHLVIYYNAITNNLMSFIEDHDFIQVPQITVDEFIQMSNEKLKENATEAKKHYYECSERVKNHYKEMEFSPIEERFKERLAKANEKEYEELRRSTDLSNIFNTIFDAK